MQSWLRKFNKSNKPVSPRNPHGKENVGLKKVKKSDWVKWSVSDVCLWLTSKGLGDYTEAFKKCKVNGESLIGITEEQVRSELEFGNKNNLHVRSFLAARNALLNANKSKHREDLMLWSVEDVAVWLESHEIFTLRETFKKNAIHGAFLMELTINDLNSIGVRSPLLVTKIELLIKQLANGTTTRDRSLQPSGWNCAKVGDWLDTIGLSRYKDVFEANSIDGLMLAHLSDAMLDQLDVRFELHRRSLALGLTQLMAKQGRTPRRASKRDKVCDWSADKVADWLASSDFDDRKLTFRANGVHGAVLVGLSNADLQEQLDMSSSIERSRLLRDIRHVCGEPVDAEPRSPGTPSGHKAAVTRKRSSDVARLSQRDDNDSVVAVSSNYGPAPPLANSEVDDDNDDASSSTCSSSSSTITSNVTTIIHANANNRPNGAARRVRRRVTPTTTTTAHTTTAATTTNNNNNNKKKNVARSAAVAAPTLPKPPGSAPPCLVCQSASANCQFEPCGHRSACIGCAALLDECPRCERPIVAMEHLD